ncbi:hypothetical protein [Microvirga massiliensis]|uniref:hypothetical protein n=1 Tax=Microvirga massiliensis TaxID=1033741 RepID=UPI00062BB9E4|nr:hypothetical protein [Microvirga massiliensis]
MIERTAVLVREKLHLVSLHQLSRRAWLAVGDYQGERIETKGTSEQSALQHWCEMARHNRA